MTSASTCQIVAKNADTVRFVVSARQFRVGIAALLTAVFLAFAVLAAIHGQWVAVAVLVPFTLVAGFMTWLRHARNQPVPFTAAALIALSGKDSLPPKTE